ncbi:MAG: 3-hydroxyacyl-ACP dehydratase FabZ [Kiritimatiellae bacterium]|nr:3-hydroxyacyl-ACP dehydratase FabZ [Kiritimatiellia bacterium]MCO5044220.1 3-hydroxyacyl-ACP dehydratase FabZ [Kiritimatiellia bacterium]MCO5061384.1 3-hydroxyacyl-ACP dehydratase FabZ [Kiritimatiellia bacterium]MCO5067542.1 3-hydroxyacyl-ACP dehydratase FabZ [Kiritimatiellia bacterium]MCO6400367.1 3-hydroxyacyl-ACP dehydratase FabZ [Verrucomicrobiota bacterium]
MSEISSKEILQILPHRYPMLLVDRVIECDMKQRIVGIKNLTIAEPCFQGHFPGDPVFPGVLQLEAIAQVGGILANKAFGGEGRIAYFLAVDRARFRRIVRPGDQLRIEVEFQRARLGMSKMSGKVYVGDELACEADIMFGYGDT